MNSEQQHILFSGGGTLGPVTPLLAIKETLAKSHPNALFFWVGTPHGPERALVEQQQIPFMALSSGKLRRYLSLLNMLDIFRSIKAFFQALYILRKHQITVCISAGGFVSVPVHLAAFFLGIPTWIHQQDVQIGLANRLMAPFATMITTTLEDQRIHFPIKKTVWLGNPVRSEILQGDPAVAAKLFSLEGNLPVVLVTGGGTGSAKINQLITEAVTQLNQCCQIIHLTGQERPNISTAVPMKFYHTYPFLNSEMKHAYAVASLVISRGGFGSLTELAALKKPVIVIPKPGHQEQNVAFLKDRDAVIVLDQEQVTVQTLIDQMQHLLTDQATATTLGMNLAQVIPIATDERINTVFARLNKSLF